MGGHRSVAVSGETEAVGCPQPCLACLPLSRDLALPRCGGRFIKALEGHPPALVSGESGPRVLGSLSLFPQTMPPHWVPHCDRWERSTLHLWATLCAYMLSGDAGGDPRVLVGHQSLPQGLGWVPCPETSALCSDFCQAWLAGAPLQGICHSWVGFPSGGTLPK